MNSWKIKGFKKVGFVLLTTLIVFCLIPVSEPTYSYSTVLNDRHGSLLGASIAEDGQWRFPEPDSIPDRISTCIQYFEDQHFYQHPGVNPLAIGRAILQNVQQGKVVSGASTITMQIARMMRRKERTLWQKLIEINIAIRLELKYSKSELMTKYASMAPFGGNVVGVEAASWRYFNRPSSLLSWGEAASLAVLPNNPGAIFPGRSNDKFLAKRNRLLRTLLEKHKIDSITYELSLLEALPDQPYPLPQQASHLLTTFKKDHSGQIISSTIDAAWQNQATKILERHHQQLSTNGVENASVIAIDLASSEVLAYVGNTNDRTAEGHEVDIIHRPRSPGSSLKPLLYAKALSKGQLLPSALLPDVPTFFGGFSPKNFSRGYEGAVAADDALIKSLNIPFVYLLRDYSYQQFHLDLKNMGFRSLGQPAGHYGLSLILGGGEVTLWELANGYLRMYQELAGNTLTEARLVQTTDKSSDFQKAFDRTAIWHTFQSMTELSRPLGEESWQTYSSSQVISWKTGTSFGFRDAWAVGLNGNLLIAVWVGNADGEGRAGLTGINAAAPLFLEIIRLSRHDPEWLEKLKPPMSLKSVCSSSGFLATEFCPSQQMEVPAEAERSGLCPYHKSVLVDATHTYIVNSSCYSLSLAERQTRFILPSTIGHFYRNSHPEYTGRGPIHPHCKDGTANPIDIVYPNEGSKVFIPIELNGDKGRVVLSANHQNKDAALYWSVGDSYYGSTQEDHQLEVLLRKGVHTLKVVDAFGNERMRTFEILNNTE